MVFKTNTVIAGIFYLRENAHQRHVRCIGYKISSDLILPSTQVRFWK